LKGITFKANLQELIMSIILGIEGTAHTFGIGILKDGKIVADTRDVFSPSLGSGLHPTEVAEHHRNIADDILGMALEEAASEIGTGPNEVMKSIEYIAYSAGPGLPPCLKATMEFTKRIAEKNQKSIVPVNHPVAHIEVARKLTGAHDPIIIYVSGGNTQIIGCVDKRYRVFGETLDIPIGNALDSFARKAGLGFPGGPIVERLALKSKNFIELPYVVKGMDLSFSGIITAALKELDKGQNLEDLCYSLQETCYAMLTEVTERALAHTGKTECLLTGGVAASRRLTGMLRIMCKDRGANFHVCPMKYAGDNGIMIAVAGELVAKFDKTIEPKDANFWSRWRVDEVDIEWL